MRPADVPVDLINLAAIVRLEHNPDGSREDLAHFLADVLPAHEAMVRARCAAEIRAIFVLARRDLSPAEAMAEAYESAARHITRGERP